MISASIWTLDAQMRQVYFFDTPDLDLDRHGVVVRPGGCRAAATTRWSSCARWCRTSCRPSCGEDDFVVEVDAMPGGFVCSGSYKGSLGRPIVKEAAAGSTR